MKKIILLILVCIGYLYPQASNTIPRRVDTLETETDSLFGYWVNKHEAQTITGQKNFSGGIVSPQTDSLFTKTSHIVNVKEFGALGDSTDQTTEIDAAMNYLNSIDGGKLLFPEGYYIYSGKVLEIPTDGVVNGNEPYIMKSTIWEGSGAFTTGRSVATAPTSGSVLILNYTGSDYRILTQGKGTWECYGMTFVIPDTTTSEFIRATNTTLWFHHNSFWGGNQGTNANQDVFVLGGGYTGTPQRGDSSGFQGYGTVISNNYFNRIRTGVYGHTFANGIIVRDNTFWNSCGSNDATKSAIKFEGNQSNPTPNNISGGLIEGNLIEVGNYPYGIRLKDVSHISFIANNFYDPSGSTLAYYYLDTSAVYNFIQRGYSGDSKTQFVEIESGTNTIIDFGQNQYTYWTQRWQFGNIVRFTNTNPLYWVNSSDITQNFNLNLGFGVQPYFDITYEDTTGSTESLFKLQRASSSVHYLLMSGANVYISASDASSNLRLTQGSGGTLWLGSAGNLYVTSSGVLTSTLSTGTAPFSTTSTTPVSNLTVERINNPTFIGEAQTDLDLGGNGLTDINNINLTSVPVDTTGLNTRDLYIEPGTNLLYAVMGVDSVVNGDFTDWTGDNPDGWSSSTEDAGNYITENPTGQCQMVTDGTVQAWTFYQTLFSIGVEYGYSFDVISASANDTIVVGMGGTNIQVLTAGSYSGTITASHTNLGIRNDYGAVDFTFDNFRVWGINGAKQPSNLIKVPDTTSVVNNYVLKKTASGLAWVADATSDPGTGLDSANVSSLINDTTTALRTEIALAYQPKDTDLDNPDLALNLVQDSLTVKANRSELGTGAYATIANYSLTSHTHTEFFDTLSYSWGIGMGNSALDTITTGTLPDVKLPNNITITEITGYTNTGTVTFNIEIRAETTPNTAGTDVMASDLVADTDQQEQTSFSQATATRNQRLAPTISAVSGDPTLFGITVRYVKTN